MARLEDVLGQYNQSNFDVAGAANAARALGARYGLTEDQLASAVPVFGDFHRSRFNSGYTEGSNYNQIAVSAVEDALRNAGRDPGVVQAENPNFVTEGAAAAQTRWAATQEDDDGFGGILGIAALALAAYTAGSSMGWFTAAEGVAASGATGAGMQGLAYSGAVAGAGGAGAGMGAAAAGMTAAEGIAYVKEAIDGIDAVGRLAEIGGTADLGAQALGLQSADAALQSLTPQFASTASAATQIVQAAAKAVPAATGSGPTTTAGGVASALGVNSVKDALGLLGTGVGVVSAVSGLLDDKGQPLRDAATAGTQAQTQIAQQLAQIAGEQWDLYKQNVVPLLKNLSTMTTTTDRTAEEIAKASGATKAAYGTARQNLTRAITANRNVGDPGVAAALAPSYTDEATAVAKAIETARVAERERVENFGFDRTLRATQAWQGLPQSATANLSGASSANNAATTGALSAARDADTRAAQGAYGGFTLANQAAKWYTGNAGVPAQQAPAPVVEGGSTYRPPAYDSTYMDAYPRVDLGQDYRHGGAIRTRRYADGGQVEGPGTGTSDSVATAKRPGTYILSADTVRAIGTKKIEDMAEKAGVRKGFGGGGGEEPEAGGVPVRLSNGEYALPPEVTQHYGTEFFDKLQVKYHRPVASDTGMANGGAIRKRTLPRMVEDAIHGHVTGAISRRSS